MGQTAVDHLVLNYQAFRGKFHIIEVHRNGAAVGCTVAKQIQNRIGYRWGVVAEIDPAQPFRQAQVAEVDVQHLFQQSAVLQLSGDTNRRGKDGIWYSLRIGDPGQRAIISWWCDHIPELQNLYALEKDITTTVMRLLRCPTHPAVGDASPSPASD